MFPSTSTDPCQVCGQKSISNNFGARSCRACAAFFRRNALDHNGFRCEKGEKKCGPKMGGKFYCKKCRLEKCFQVGMNPKKFQLNRDVLKTASVIPRSMAQFLGRPTLILCCEPEKASRCKSILDVSPMIRAAETIFRQSSGRPNCLESDGLGELTRKFEKMRCNDKMTIVELITKEIALQIWEDAFLDTATWLTGWQEFRIIPEKIQMLIVKSGWLLWSKLEHLAQTADYIRQSVVSSSILKIGNGIGIDRCNMDFDTSWVTNYSKEQTKPIMKLDLNGNFSNILKWLVELNPSGIELNYMLCHVCLYMAGKRHPEISELTEHLIELQADQLHNYYRKTMRNSNYLGRIGKMKKIDNLLFEDMRQRDERNQIIVLFDVFCFEFSDKEMFRGS